MSNIPVQFKKLLDNLKEAEGGDLHRNTNELDVTNGWGIYRGKGLGKSFTPLWDYVDTIAKQVTDKPSDQWTKDECELIDNLLDKDKEEDFYVLRKTKSPAVLLECGFFDNWQDFELLKDPLFQANLGSFILFGPTASFISLPSLSAAYCCLAIIIFSAKYSDSPSMYPEYILLASKGSYIESLVSLAFRNLQPA